MTSQRQLTRVPGREAPKIFFRKGTSTNDLKRNALRNIQNYSQTNNVFKINKRSIVQKSKENGKVVQVKMSPKTLEKVKFFDSKINCVKHTESNTISLQKDTAMVNILYPNTNYQHKQECYNVNFRVARPIPVGIADIDKGAKDPIQYNEYASEVLSYLRKLETKSAIRSDFLSDQSEANREMRADLVDWVHRNASQLQLYEETYYLAIAIVDLYLQNVDIPANCLPLLGITAILIASKYEEVSTPDITELVKIAQFRYSRSDILGMECSVLKVLDFRIGRPVPIQFLRRYSQANKCGRLCHNLSKFFLELSLLNDRFSSVAPSLMAAAASCLSFWVLSNLPWTPEIEFYSGYSSQEVAPVTRQLAKFVQCFHTLKNQAITKKFSSDNYLKVAQLPQLSAIVECFP